MSITKCPGHMRSLKLNFSAAVLTLGLKAKIFENLRPGEAKVWGGELRTRAPFDRCVRRCVRCVGPEVAILGADQKERCLWGRECLAL